MSTKYAALAESNSAHEITKRLSGNRKAEESKAAQQAKPTNDANATASHKALRKPKKRPMQGNKHATRSRKTKNTLANGSLGKKTTLSAIVITTNAAKSLFNPFGLD